ncbi:hypothetical protein BJ165DRAFT_1525653 [Panaeolus papilionaceus]|nr:hypothetical protein BJ165DRAFT_1525653 [Panaeolus papilionaceus]
MDCELAQTSIVLPAELELAIFELAFDPSDNASSLNYMLVAKRVYEWIRPLVFRVFDQIDRPPFPNFEKYDDVLKVSELGRFARHLVIGRLHSGIEIADMLQHMPNVRDLAIWYGVGIKPLLPVIEKLQHLERLSCGLNGLDSSQLLHPVFTNLTHLELLSPRSDWDFKVLESYKRLTHLCIYSGRDWDTETVMTVLSHCRSLKVFILTEDCATGVPEEMRDLCKDHHALLIFANDVACHRDWKRGAYGGDDSWVLAERLVEARERGFFTKEHYEFGYISTKNEWRNHFTDKGNAWFEALPPLRDLCDMQLTWADKKEVW